MPSLQSILPPFLPPCLSPCLAQSLPLYHWTRDPLVLASRALSHSSPTIWNSLPPNIRSSTPNPLRPHFSLPGNPFLGGANPPGVTQPRDHCVKIPPPPVTFSGGYPTPIRCRPMFSCPATHFLGPTPPHRNPPPACQVLG